MGAVRPSSGSGQVLGLTSEDPTQGVGIRKRVAFVGEDKGLYDYMTVEQIIGFTKSFFPRWRSDLERKFLRDFPLPFDRKIKKLSKGCEEKEIVRPLRPGPSTTEEVSRCLPGPILQRAHRARAFLDPWRFPEEAPVVCADVEQIADHVFIIDRGDCWLAPAWTV